MGGAEGCGFRDETSVLSCDASGQAHAAEWAGVNSFGMAVTVEMHNTGDSVLRSEIIAVVEHVLSDRPGDWSVSIISSKGQRSLGDEDPLGCTGA